MYLKIELDEVERTILQEVQISDNLTVKLETDDDLNKFSEVSDKDEL